MNLLTDALPITVEIANTEYQIETGFRTCLRVILAFEDNELTPQEKQIILLSSVFVDMPTDTQEAIKKANWFLNGGDVAENEEGPRLFSFAKDAQLIFAAFRATHGIDLSTADLHWWQFLASFMDLGQDTTFCQLVALRKRVKTGKASKEEKAAAREMGDLFDVPDVDSRSLEQKEAERKFFELVAEGQKKRNEQSQT